MLEWEDIGMESHENQQPAMSGWSIQNLLQDKMLWQAAKDDWQKSSLEQANLSISCTKEDLDEEVERFEGKMVELPNTHAKITRISAFSKRWWNEEVVKPENVGPKIKEYLVVMIIRSRS